MEATAYLSVIRRISESLAARQPGREDRENRWVGGRRAGDHFSAPRGQPSLLWSNSVVDDGRRDR